MHPLRKRLDSGEGRLGRKIAANGEIRVRYCPNRFGQARRGQCTTIVNKKRNLQRATQVPTWKTVALTHQRVRRERAMTAATGSWRLANHEARDLVDDLNTHPRPGRCEPIS